MKDFRAITQKGSGESYLLSKYVYRPFTTYITRLYAHLGLSANTATLHSVIAALFSAIVLFKPGPPTFLAAAIGLQVYFILDHVDGELARLRRWADEPGSDSAEGLYLDYWAHFHGYNLALAALGIGLSVYTGQLAWAALGLLADNAVGNFPRLVLGRTLWILYERHPTVLQHQSTRLAIQSVTQSEHTIESSGRGLTQRLKRLLLELVLFPGYIVVLSLVLALDGLVSVAQGAFQAYTAQAYLVLFVLATIPAKIRRTRLCMQYLREI